MEDDQELAELRAQRMAQLQGQMGGGSQPGDQQKREEAMRREVDMRNSILSQILDQNARARLNSIALVKPEKAKMLENMLIQMAQRGQLSGKMNEDGLKSVLASISQQTEKSTKVTINRRRYAMDSDEDDY
ncbi:programmed cell death protein 5-like [Rhopilema esculentum]|uniref:programmed cell death protein 5-like n=1 Tax=Rhopilema esculentum TaxID=499914 RepID=UPI0031D0B6FE